MKIASPGTRMSEPDDPLLGDYLEGWLQRRRTQVRPATLNSYRRCVRNHLRPLLGSLRLSEIDRRGVERLWSDMLASGAVDGGPLSPRTIQQFHAILRRALEDACLDGLLERNPLQHASPPKQHAGAVELDDDPQVWTFAQAARFLASIEHHRLAAFWHLGLSTGARRGELAGLRWKDVDLDSRDITIRRSLNVVDGVARLLRTKSSGSRRLAIGHSVAESLERHRQHQHAERTAAGDEWDNRWDLVFRQPSGRYVFPGSFTYRHRKLVQLVDVPVIRLHDLRHTHASLLLQLGVPIKTISERLGHASVTTTMDTYAHLLPAMDRDAADTFAEILLDAGD